MDAWGGIAALQFGLPVMWTNLKHHRFGLADLTRLMSDEPAKLAALDDRKGKLAAGYDADIVIWNPEAEFEITTDIIQHRHKLTPYSGMKLFGKIEATIVGGNKVFENGEFNEQKFGKLLT